ncbi:MAG: hypothetical protein ACUVQK_10250, partial [Thermogutta sp.]
FRCRGRTTLPSARTLSGSEEHAGAARILLLAATPQLRLTERRALGYSLEYLAPADSLAARIVSIVFAWKRPVLVP